MASVVFDSLLEDFVTYPEIYTTELNKINNLNEKFDKAQLTYATMTFIEKWKWYFDNIDERIAGHMITPESTGYVGNMVIEFKTPDIIIKPH